MRRKKKQAKKEEKPKIRPLCPEMGERKIRALQRLYEDYPDITPEDRDRIIKGIIARVKAYGSESDD